VDFCQVLTAAPEYQGRTFRTEIIVVPTLHGMFATTHACKARKIIHFAEGSFTGSPALQRLDAEVDKAEPLNLEDPTGPLKAVAVRVTARVERVWRSVPGVSSPQPGYVLRLLDADDGRLVDRSDDLLPPLPPGLK
jgi:hypothetical protein